MKKAKCVTIVVFGILFGTVQPLGFTKFTELNRAWRHTGNMFGLDHRPKQIKRPLRRYYYYFDDLKYYRE